MQNQFCFECSNLIKASFDCDEPEYLENESSNFSQINFTNADLHQAVFGEVFVFAKDVNFQGANLSDTVFEGINFEEVTIEKNTKIDQKLLQIIKLCHNQLTK
ncbi:MAG: pentapeptide repeat-containing protein [Microcoleaceae cyanobacterium MO_207.B10]|nr:pentapeptide repeat-containing protein [Microcoleaceae cyanobacterium MO_207.B10]